MLEGGDGRMSHGPHDVHAHLMLRESLDDTLHHLLEWDTELLIDEPVDDPEPRDLEEPEV